MAEADGGFAHGLVGVTLDGRYRLDAVLGEGGMGAVFRATHLAMDRKVAVKLLKPHLTSDHTALQRFAREAKVTRKVESPHAVEVFDFGVTPLGDYYMVLEYLDGRTVQKELDIDGAFAPARVAHVARQALHALGVAHDLGLIHRDVKPDNLLLMRVGADADYTKILDFGVAKLMQGAAAEQLALTAAGMVFGTPEFMSPEQACGLPLDGRSDLYSLAATMFVMLTGHGLFEGQTAIEWLTHHARTPAPRLAMVRPELAAYPELDDVLQRCLAKPRELRPASAGEMARLLAAIEPTLRRPPGRAPATLSVPIGPHGPPLTEAPTPPGHPRASSSAQRAFHASNYFRALAAGELAGSMVDLPAIGDTLTGAASSAEHALPPPRS
ncbi:MAG TPA: serine/threonine-protein kinase, partial [Kofleriaceae bacterium]|nr:serine/threonine-protein kinase [Kofleriaceae bacterium]